MLSAESENDSTDICTIYRTVENYADTEARVLQKDSELGRVADVIGEKIPGIKIPPNVMVVTEQDGKVYVPTDAKAEPNHVLAVRVN